MHKKNIGILLGKYTKLGRFLLFDIAVHTSSRSCSHVLQGLFTYSNIKLFPHSYSGFNDIIPKIFDFGLRFYNGPLPLKMLSWLKGLSTFFGLSRKDQVIRTLNIKFISKYETYLKLRVPFISNS